MEHIRRNGSCSRGGPGTADRHGAGVFVPEIGRSFGNRMGLLVFLDAVVPPPQGMHFTSAAIKRLLDEKTPTGALPRWLDWWPPGVVAARLPNPSDRAALAADMPVLPRSFYEEAVPLPGGWSDWRCGYLKLSTAYAPRVRRGRQPGLPPHLD